jgi:hypothetical protein
MKVGYDMDGVLAQGPNPSKKPWRFMSGVERAGYKNDLLYAYEKAHPLLIPKDPSFVVISARKDNADVRSVTDKWLKRYGERVSGVYLLKVSRSLENVISFKSQIINELGLTDFTEDNPAVVKGLRTFCPKTRIWLYKEGLCRLDYRC